MNIGIREIVLDLEIDAPKDRVWQAMLNELPSWWPKDFLALAGSEGMKFEPFAGGRLYEETADGQHILWAHVAMIVPGKAIETIGHMTPTYGGPSITMVRMAISDGENGKTAFRLTDSILGRIDDEQEANMTEGWNHLFGNGLKAYCEAKAT